MIRLRTVLLLFLGILAVSANRVLLRDITSITLHRGQYTTGRRASPVAQIQCVGGTAQGKFSPKTVQCYNRGFDGLSTQWECQAEMPLDYQFGKISVTCEGYDYPEDPYILAGSCGLKYELDYSNKGAKHGAFSTGGNSTNYTSIIYFVIIAFVLYLLYLTMTSTRDGNEGDRNRGGNSGFWPGGGGGGNDGPHPPGWRPPGAPPSYDETFNKNSGSSNNARPNTGTGSNFGGFWTGTALGGLGGYLFGRNWGNNDQGARYRRRGPTQFERDTGFYSDSSYYDQPSTSSHYHSSSSPSSSSTHTSSGFGGTERR